MEEVLVLGRRSSKQRPLGFLRGELEELADRVLLDALAYDAAVSGVPLRLECATAVEEYPDFHSGYKLFSRRTAAGEWAAAVISQPGLRFSGGGRRTCHSGRWIPWAFSFHANRQSPAIKRRNPF